MADNSEVVTAPSPSTSEPTATRSEADRILAGGGETGAMMRGKDWKGVGLGPTSTWPQSLRTSISITLEARLPMVVASEVHSCRSGAGRLSHSDDRRIGRLAQAQELVAQPLREKGLQFHGTPPPIPVTVEASHPRS